MKWLQRIYLRTTNINNHPTGGVGRGSFILVFRPSAITHNSANRKMITTPQNGW